jgi:hypothetical protein
VENEWMREEMKVIHRVQSGYFPEETTGTSIEGRSEPVIATVQNGISNP